MRYLPFLILLTPVKQSSPLNLVNRLDTEDLNSIENEKIFT